jgi:hypothetical protein
LDNRFFDQPILNSPYEYPACHWELDESGQATGKLVERRRSAEFITPIPKPKKRKTSALQPRLVLDEGTGLSTAQQATSCVGGSTAAEHPEPDRLAGDARDGPPAPEAGCGDRHTGDRGPDAPAGDSRPDGPEEHPGAQ